MRKFSIFVSILCFIAAIICIIKLASTNFVSIVVLPLAYAVVFLGVFPLSYRYGSTQITTVIVYALFFVRMVFLPLYGIIDGYFESEVSSYLRKYCNLSVELSVYEYIVVSLLLLWLSSRKKTPISRPTLYLYGNRWLYFGLVLVAIILYLAVGRTMGLFEFGFKSIGSDLDRSGDIEEGGIVRLLISAGLTFSFLLFSSYFSNQYRYHQNRRYVVYSILVAMMMICIITGERRTSQVYKGFACIWLLIGLYPVYKKRISRSLVIVASIVIVGMTLYKNYHAFLYDSYYDALRNASGIGMSTSILDAYFYGVNTISKNLAFSDMAFVDYTNLIYDFARNIFGLNLIIPRDLPLTSQIYNMSFSYGEVSTGYLLSSVGYGYIFLGTILAPFFTCLNVWIMILLERMMKSTSSIEMSYILAFLYMRFGFGFLGSFPPLINMATKTLFVTGGIVLIASLFNKSLQRSR